MSIHYDRDVYIEYITALLSEKRRAHSLGTEKMAVRLAEYYGADREKASAAALLHDSAKELPDMRLLALAEEYGVPVDPIDRNDPDLLHGPVAAQIVRRSLGIEDKEILLAIQNHTTGAPGMCPLEKILYVADLLEETRHFPGVEELRRHIEEGLDRILLLSMRSVLANLIDKGKPIQRRSICAYNALILK